MNQQPFPARIIQHPEPKPYIASAYVWKCRNCGATKPDEIGTVSETCTCKGVMDLTPVRRK